MRLLALDLLLDEAAGGEVDVDVDEPIFAVPVADDESVITTKIPAERVEDVDAVEVCTERAELVVCDPEDLLGKLEEVETDEIFETLEEALLPVFSVKIRMPLIDQYASVKALGLFPT